MTLARQLGFVLEASVQTSRAGDLLQSAKGVLWDAAPCRNWPRVFCGMQHHAGIGQECFVGCSTMQGTLWAVIEVSARDQPAPPTPATPPAAYTSRLSILVLTHYL